jgi:protein SCO1/2
MIRVAILVVLLTLSASELKADESSLPPALRKVAFDQRLNEQVPLELEFTDENGQTVSLRDYFGRGKPVILNLAYFRCPMLCGEVSNGLLRAMLDMDLNVGTDYDLITVSFDHRETPAMAAAKKKTYLERFGRANAGAGWHFLTGKKESIEQLTRAVGFRFDYDARHDQFAHASGIIVLTPEGNISRYFYDIRYAPRDLRLGLVEASANRIGSPVDQVLLFCFHYDPAEGRYGVAIMNLVRLGGVLTMAAVGMLIFYLWRTERRRGVLTLAAKAGA